MDKPSDQTTTSDDSWPWTSLHPGVCPALPHPETVHHRFGRDDLEVIGVDVREDKKKAEEFVSATKVTFPVVLDDGTLESKYKVYMFPVVLVFDRQSHLLYRFEGNDEKVGDFVAGLLRH